MRWYRSWASLYMLRAPIISHDTYYPRAPGKRLKREHILNTKDVFQRYFGKDEDTEFQHSINHYEKLCRELWCNMHISDSRYRHRHSRYFIITAARCTSDGCWSLFYISG